jgi:hypothetical protein
MPRGKANGAAKNGVGGNKMEAVRQAIGALGKKAKPKKLHEHILGAFKLDISPNMISSYKSTILKSRGKKGKKHAPKANGAAVSASLRIEDVQTVKDLATRLGVKGLNELVALLT